MSYSVLISKALLSPLNNAKSTIEFWTRNSFIAIVFFVPYLFINNLLISENPSAPSFNLNGSNFEAFSKGYNVYQRVTGITMSASDTAYPNQVNGALNEEGVYVWDLNQIGSVKGYATRQAVIEVAKSFNPVASPITNLGEVFVEWIGEDAFGIDQRGVTRNANKMQAGAYDAVLAN